MIDLEDLAEVVSIILTNSHHIGATYELCGPENLSLSDMVMAIEEQLNNKINVETIDDKIFSSQLKNHGAKDYEVDTLLKMFHHYNEYGFIGNDNIATWLLNRKPNNFSSFILRTLENK